MIFEKLFKYDSKDRLRSWSIFIDGADYWTEAGLEDGKMNKSMPTTCTPKNVGRSNETTAEEQAVLEVKSLINKKQVKEKYISGELLTLMGGVRIPRDYFEFVMLGKVYSERAEKGKLNYPYFQSPKLDGIRMYHSTEQTSRGHKRFFATPHLGGNIEELKLEIAKVMHDMMITSMVVGVGNITTDGELYSHTLKDNFEKIVSLVRTQKEEKLTDEFLKESAASVEYHVFDFHVAKGFGTHVDLTFSQRTEILRTAIENINPKYLRFVEQILVENEEEAFALHEKFIAEGYEGSMFKEPDSFYEQKKSDKLLKLKPFFDEEFAIVDMEDGKGNWNGAAKAIEFFGVAEGYEDKEKGKFEATFKGSRDRAKALFENKGDYIGKLATVRYDSVTTKGRPRFGRVIEIRDYE